MVTTTSEEYEAVLDTVHHWTSSQQFALLHEILHMVASEGVRANRPDSLPPRRANTLAQAIGVGAGNYPPPTDEDVRRWIEEWRLEKYG